MTWQSRPVGDGSEQHGLPVDSGVKGRGVINPASTEPALPNALELARALRPWKRHGRETDHSEPQGVTTGGYGVSIGMNDAADQSGRCLDLDLVVDRSPTMAVWQDTVTALRAVLDGVYRTVEIRDLTFDDDGVPQLPAGQRTADRTRVVIVVSDCAAAAWRRPGIWLLLRQWASATPAALLNPLPMVLWRRTGLNLPAGRMTPTTPGGASIPVPGSAVPLARGGGDWLPVPLLSLSPHSLSRWSRAVADGDPEGCAAVLVPSEGRPPSRRHPRSIPRPLAARVEGFLFTAAPEAARLAVLCSALGPRVPLPLLQRVCQELIPDATTAHIAETLTCDLFTVGTTADGTVELQLTAEVADLLGAHLAAHEVWQLRRVLSQHYDAVG